MEQERSKSGLLIFLGILVLSIISVFLLLKHYGSQNEGSKNPSASSPPGQNPASQTLATELDGNDEPAENQTAEELIGRIAEIMLKANESGDASDLLDFIGRQNLSPEQIKQITDLAASGKLALQSKQSASTSPGEPKRWQLELADKASISLELTKNKDGSWQVSSVSLPGPGTNPATEAGPAVTKNQDAPPPAEEGSAEALVNRFMQAITRLDPAAASQYIDRSKISYVTLAGLCIIFEEGEYALLEKDALRKMFLRDTASGWVARLKSKNTGESAMFAINAKRADINAPWKITEINLDNLLTDYAKGMLGGDIQYSPLIKNPRGGDSLAIYFDLDAKDLIPRTKRQLIIVANLLKADKGKKLTITGHTDALGTDLYNLALSRERADAVMSFLAQSGVEQTQMNIVGYGETRPRLPNTADDGSDSPEGRRANRRAEILLDF